eukprot:5264889-Lingulodinium_polyedra.AAC.1
MELLDDESKDGCFCTDEELERLVREAMPAAGRPRGAAAAACATTGKAGGVAQEAAPLAPDTQP